MIFIFQDFQTIVFIFIVIFTTFRQICLLAFFKRTYQPKRWEYSDKDEDHSPKTLNDKNKQKLIFQKFISAPLYSILQMKCACARHCINFAVYWVAKSWRRQTNSEQLGQISRSNKNHKNLISSRVVVYTDNSFSVKKKKKKKIPNNGLNSNIIPLLSF